MGNLMYVAITLCIWGLISSVIVLINWKLITRKSLKVVTIMTILGNILHASLWIFFSTYKGWEGYGGLGFLFYFVLPCLVITTIISIIQLIMHKRSNN